MNTSTPLSALSAHQRASLKQKAAKRAATLLVANLLANSTKPISERAASHLFNLTLQATLGGDFGRYFEPLELGGRTKSNHSSDLALLTEAGLVERIDRNFTSLRPSYLYRPALLVTTIAATFQSEFARLTLPLAAPSL